MTTVAQFRFEELNDNVRPVDAAANMNDLSDDPASTPALTTPPIVTAITGRGRQFDTDVGFVGTEAVADSTRLTRDLTVRAWLRYEIGNASNGERGTIVARGRRGSAAERLIWGLEIERVSATHAKVRWRWEEIGGGAAVVTAYEFIPNPVGFFEIAAVRRWVNTTEVELEYYANATLLGSETVAFGDIGEGVGGSLTVGCAGDSLGDYELFLPTDSIIDSISIEDDAMSAEEIRQDFRMVSVHQPSGYQILKSYIPPGEAYTTDPTSNVRKWIAAEGDAIGHLLGLGERMHEDLLPDRAYGAALEKWEELTGLTPALGATIAERRTALLGFLRKTGGYTIADLKDALGPLFGLTGSQIDIIEFTGVRTDDFATDDITTPPSSMWRTLTQGATISVAAGICRLDQTGGTVNAIWPNACPRRETSVTGDGAVFVVTVDNYESSTDVDGLVGQYWRSTDSNNAVFWGVIDDGGGWDVSYFTVVDNVVSAVTSVVASVTEPVELYSRYLGSGEFQLGRIVAGAITIDATITPFSVDPKWCGMIAVHPGAATGDLFAEFDDASVFEPETRRAFHFMAYRNPALSGVYDINTAQQQLDKQSPAHVVPAAVTDTRGFLHGPTGTGRHGIDPLYPKIS